jgi:hypothetical protein
LLEILELADDRTLILSLGDSPPFEVYVNFTNSDIQSLMGATLLTNLGQQGVDVLHFPNHRAYALLVTFKKSENEFSPSTMYADYPIKMVWQLDHPMPAEMFENCRKGG